VVPGGPTDHDPAYSFCIILCYCLDWLDVPLENTPERLLREVLRVEFKSIKHDNHLFADNQFAPSPLTLISSGSWAPDYDESVPTRGGDLVWAHALGADIPAGRKILLDNGQRNCINHYYCVSP
jgi:hypothetical protein